MDNIQIKKQEFAPIEVHEQGQYAVMVATAKKYPRGTNWINPIISYLTSDFERAMDCLYAKPFIGEYTAEQKHSFTQLSKSEIKKRKLIVGASTYFARQVASAYQNFLIETIIIEETQTAVIVQARGWDMETNKIETKQWSESIVGNKGRYSQNQIEIIKQSAQAKAYRSVLLTIVPEYIWVPILDAVKKYLAPTPEPEKPIDFSKDPFVINAIKYLKDKGLTEIDLLKYLQVDSFESMESEDALALRALGNSIRNGETTVNEIKVAEPKKIVIHKNN